MKTEKFVLPIAFLALGLIIAFGSFAFALANFGFGLYSLANGRIEGFLLMFVLHLVAMAGLVFGGLLTSIGTYWGGFAALKQLFDSTKK